MRHALQLTKTPLGVIVIGLMAAVLVVAGFLITQANASSGQPDASHGRLVTIHDRNTERVILTKASTVKQALDEAHVQLDHNDRVEPRTTEKLIALAYTVNIYRARPVIVVDGAVRQKVMTAHQTSDKIAADANMKLHDEDKTTLKMSDDIVSDGAGLELDIDRATPFTLVLYGKKTQMYTQETTVEAMLRSKHITLGPNDTLSVPMNTALTANMTLELWRNGKQTVTEEQDIVFDVEQIQDADHPTGYREVKTPGEKGKRSVTYEVVMKNGQELSRKEIQSVTITQPKKQVEIVGTKPSFSGDFAAALAKLRSCEGSYTSVNPAGYYGAYQFTQSAWNSNAPAGYSGINPTTAPPAVQDQAARNYYVKSGWRPWPNCGKGLPDIYR